jgi:hypothetical protein
MYPLVRTTFENVIFSLAVPPLYDKTPEVAELGIKTPPPDFLTNAAGFDEYQLLPGTLVGFGAEPFNCDVPAVL